jgi:hypothetical protein
MGDGSSATYAGPADTDSAKKSKKREKRPLDLTLYVIKGPPRERCKKDQTRGNPTTPV